MIPWDGAYGLIDTLSIIIVADIIYAIKWWWWMWHWPIKASIISLLYSREAYCCKISSWVLRFRQFWRMSSIIHHRSA